MALVHKLNGGYIGAPVDATGDPYWDSCVLALRCDGANGSTTFTDLSPANRGNATVSGNAQVSTTQSKYYGSSLYLDGSGDDINFADAATLDMGAEDFHFRAWIRFASVAGTQVFATKGYCFSPCFLDGGVFKAQLQRDDVAGGGGGPTVSLNGTTSIAANTWYFYEMLRTGSAWYLKVNGVVEATASNSFTIADTSNPFRIGRDHLLGSNCNCFANDIQLYKGAANTAYTGSSRPFMARRYPSGVQSLKNNLELVAGGTWPIRTPTILGGS